MPQSPQLKPDPQLTPLSEIETYGGNPTLKLNPEKVGTGNTSKEETEGGSIKAHRGNEDAYSVVEPPRDSSEKDAAAREGQASAREA